MEPLKQSTLLSKLPDVPFTDDQRGKYVLHAEDDGHFMITLNGRVVDNNYHFSAQDLKSMGYSQGYPIKIFLELDWNSEPGRTAGCFNAKPYACYVPYIERSLKEIESSFEELRKEWNVSEAKVQLQKHMSRILQNANCHQLQRVISFGTGSLQSVTQPDWRATCFQILALLTMLESINEGRRQEQFARCFSQDPIYSDYDKQFLHSLGIEPVEDPEGFLLVTNDSVVCDWRTYDYISRKISERPWPAVLIQGEEELHMVSDNLDKDSIPEYLCSTPFEAQRFQNMMKDREELPLSTFPYLWNLELRPGKGNRFWQPNIYCRKPSVIKSGNPEAFGDAAIEHV